MRTISILECRIGASSKVGLIGGIATGVSTRLTLIRRQIETPAPGSAIHMNRRFDGSGLIPACRTAKRCMRLG